MKAFNNLLVGLKQNPVFRNGALFTFFSFLNNGVGFLLLLILAKYVPPDGYGELNLFTTFVTLLGILISLGTPGIISIEYFNSNRFELKRMINCVLLITTVVLIVLSVFLLFFSTSLKAAIGISPIYQWIALFICFFQVLTNIILDIWRLEEKPISYGIFSFFIVLLNFILTLVFVISLDMKWQGRVYAQIGTGAFFFIISIYFLVKKNYIRKIIPSKHSIKKALAFGIPLIPHSASFWIRQGADRYIINLFFTTSVVGMYSFAYNFANIIQIIGVAFNATNSVFIYKNLALNPEKAKPVLLKQTRLMIVFFIVITIIIFFGSYFFIPLMLPKYSESIKYLFPLCLGSMCQCVYLLFVNYLFYYKKTKQLMYITFGFSLLHLGLCILFTRYTSLITAYIMLLTNFMICVSVILYSNKLFPLLKNRIH